MTLSQMTLASLSKTENVKIILILKCPQKDVTKRVHVGLMRDFLHLRWLFPFSARSHKMYFPALYNMLTRNCMVLF